MITLDGKSLNLDTVSAIAAGESVALSKGVRKRIDKSRKLVEKLARGDEPYYAINTGFGFFASKKIDKSALRELQRNIILSHASGSGNPLSQAETRVAMCLRLNVLVKGLTGVRYELCQALLRLISAEIYPIIPEYGSVGASGDLAPLAHIALTLIGEGEVIYRGKRMTSAAALRQARLKPIVLAEKEGLSLINGTQIMLAVGSLALIEGLRLADLSDQAAALSFEALEALPGALDPLVHRARNQRGQIESARSIREHLRGTKLGKQKPAHARVQDPYSLRCAPQVHGASHDLLQTTVSIVERELNAATDNPLVFPEQGKVVSAGNFHGQPLAVAYDVASIALCELANISERRLELLMNPQFSKLNAFLSPQEGLQSGYMAMQYLSASLVNENKILSHPASTDSIPGNVGVEDHVSMGMTAARKLRQIVSNTKKVLCCEMLAACQALDLRGKGQIGFGAEELYEKVRKAVPPLMKDRIIANDISACLKAFE